MLVIPAWVKPAAIAVVVLLIMGGTAAFIAGVFNKGEKAGAANVTTTVQQETIKQTEKARIQKEKVNEDVRRTPFTDRVDELR